MNSGYGSGNSGGYAGITFGGFSTQASLTREQLVEHERTVLKRNFEIAERRLRELADGTPTQWARIVSSSKEKLVVLLNASFVEYPMPADVDHTEWQPPRVVRLIPNDKGQMRPLALVPKEFDIGAGTSIGRCIAVTSTTIVLLLNQAVMDVRPEDVPEEMRGLGADLVGRLVRIVSGTKRVLELVDAVIDVGAIVPVKEVLDESYLEIEPKMGEPTRAVLYGGEPPRPGDRVMLDPSNTVVIRKLGKPKASSMQSFTGDTGVTWDDIIGLDDAKRALKEAIAEPLRRPEVYKAYGRKPVKGVLLEGPPRNGKTMLAKAVATMLAEMFGKKGVPSGFLSVKGPELLNKFLGESEANIRRLFESARDHKRQHGYPALIFLDEADALLGKRGVAKWEGIERTVVPMFLAEMDGMDDSGAIVLLATNRPDALDQAVVGEGRIDQKIHIPRPTNAECPALFAHAVKKKPLDGCTAEAFAACAADKLFAPELALYKVRTKSSVIKGAESSPKIFTLGHVVSRAMIVDIVEGVAQIAIRRDVEADKVTGIRIADLDEVIARKREEQMNLDHANDLNLFVEPFKTELLGVDRVRKDDAKRDGAERPSLLVAP